MQRTKKLSITQQANLFLELYSAVSRQKISEVKHCLNLGVSPNFKDEYQKHRRIESFQRSPLSSAAYHGNLKLVKLLVKHGAIINDYSRKPLNTSSLFLVCNNLFGEESVSIVKFFLDNGAYVDGLPKTKIAKFYSASTPPYHNPLGRVIYNIGTYMESNDDLEFQYSVEVVKMLLHHDADIKIIDYDRYYNKEEEPRVFDSLCSFIPKGLEHCKKTKDQETYDKIIEISDFVIEKYPEQYLEYMALSSESKVAPCI